MNLLQVLFIVAFTIGSVQVCSANWLDNIAVASLWTYLGSANGRVNAGGLCLDFAPETANGEGAVAALWGCHAPTDGHADNQRFGVWISDRLSFYDRGETWYDMSISHVHNGVRYCLDVDHGLAHNGAKIHHGQAPQLFSINWRTSMIQYAADRRFCLSATSFSRNGARLELRDCKSEEDAEKFKLAPLGEVITNFLPMLNSRCYYPPPTRCSFDCRFTGDQSLIEYWVDGARIACGLKGGNLFCLTAVPSLGPVVSLAPVRFPVPQQRTSPDMPLELRQAYNATAGHVA
ncbi:hypothetical protein GGF31_006926 [Allomyces arbusculus]|nr:hypothetical protein GGF31_006926 [Allomyces arbusculus]